MLTPHASAAAGDLRRVVHVRRIVITLAFSALGGLMLSPGWRPGPASVLVRTGLLGLLAMIVFGILERWPRHLPAWLARWTLQVTSVALSVPLGTYAIYVLTTPVGAPPFWQVPERMEGFVNLSVLGVLLAPWVALGALVRQKDALARHQALSFALERSELERQALDARLRLLQAQVTPHFLFNTLSNVQALVDSGSPRAAELLRSLIAYLRAAVPRLDEPVTTVGDELQLVRAYLELMHMRMPDRLHYALNVDDSATLLRCPPMTLLTLVENAVSHGIDPSEEGGRIVVEARRHGDRCRVRVCDTGTGPGRPGQGLGTGLARLRERLAVVFGDDVSVGLTAHGAEGTCVELDFPARPEAGA